MFKRIRQKRYNYVLLLLVRPMMMVRTCMRMKILMLPEGVEPIQKAWKFDFFLICRITVFAVCLFIVWTSTSPFFVAGFRYLKNHTREVQDFSVKIEVGWGRMEDILGVLSLYGYCSNVLYLASNQFPLLASTKVCATHCT